MISDRIHRAGVIGPCPFSHRRLYDGLSAAVKLLSPAIFSPTGCVTGIVGALVGFPGAACSGIYLVIATISFAFIVEESWRGGKP